MAHLRAQDHDGLLEGFQGTSKTKAAESWCSQLPESSSGLTWWPRIVGRDGFEIRVYDKGAIGAKDISGA